MLHSKRELVVTTEDQYPQHIMDFTMINAILDGYKVGERVKVSINLEAGNTLTRRKCKYFNGIQAWRIERTVAGQFTPLSNSTWSVYQTKKITHKFQEWR
jgi:hypothetical protein